MVAGAVLHHGYPPHAAVPGLAVGLTVALRAAGRLQAACSTSTSPAGDTGIIMLSPAGDQQEIKDVACRRPAEINRRLQATMWEPRLARPAGLARPGQPCFYPIPCTT